MEKITVDKKDIAAVIGKGGATIREIVEKSGAKVDVNDEGVVTVAAPDEESRNIAMQMIKDITAKAELNKIYSATCLIESLTLPLSKPITLTFTSSPSLTTSVTFATLLSASSDI